MCPFIFTSPVVEGSAISTEGFPPLCEAVLLFEVTDELVGVFVGCLASDWFEDCP